MRRKLTEGQARLFDLLVEAIGHNQPWRTAWFNEISFEQLIRVIDDVHQLGPFASFGTDGFVQRVLGDASFLRKQQLRYAIERSLLMDVLKDCRGLFAMTFVSPRSRYLPSSWQGQLPQLRVVCGYLDFTPEYQTALRIQSYAIRKNPAEPDRFMIGGDEHVQQKNWFKLPGVHRLPKEWEAKGFFPQATGPHIDIENRGMWEASLGIVRALRALSANYKAYNDLGILARRYRIGMDKLYANPSLAVNQDVLGALLAADCMRRAAHFHVRAGEFQLPSVQDDKYDLRWVASGSHATYYRGGRVLSATDAGEGNVQLHFAGGDVPLTVAKAEFEKSQHVALIPQVRQLHCSKDSVDYSPLAWSTKEADVDLLSARRPVFVKKPVPAPEASEAYANVSGQ